MADRELPAYGLANEPISAVVDKSTRDALMAVRSEGYRLMDRLAEKNDDLKDLITTIGRQIQSHADTCSAEKKDGMQFRESMQRLAERFTKDFGQHVKDDDKFQKGLGRQVITILIGALGTCVIAIGSLVWDKVQHPYVLVEPSDKIEGHQ